MSSFLNRFAVLMLAALIWSLCATAQEPAEPKPAEPEAAVPVTQPAERQQEKESAASEGAALRNENVFASKMDTDTQKADNVRLGGTYVMVVQPLVESNYFAAEFGRSPSAPSVLNSLSTLRTWHGEIYENHQNSVFNARTFFQAGSVKPSRVNNYGGRFSGGLGWLGLLSGSFDQGKNRGMVNGNVLVPLRSERTPRATDPATRAIVQRFLDAFPDEEPNRVDFDARALNTNAPQSIDSINGTLRLDRPITERSRLSLFHSINRQEIHAFQFVAGLNPDTNVHSQQSRITLRHIANESSEFAVGLNYYRNRSDLHSEPNAVGPRVRMARSIENLGPDSNYPLNRAENTFRLGAVGYRRAGVGGKHRLTYGGEFTRYQLNGLEQNGIRGDFQFNNNFGRTAVENLLLGTPSQYLVTIGNMNRGFRTWGTDVFFADQWTVRRNLQLYIGVRHNITSKPVEVNHVNELPFSNDVNNFAPRFSLAWRGPRDMIVRAGYSVSFGQILPVTYSQARYNLPGAISLVLNNPNLVNPLAGIDLSPANVVTSPTVFSPDMVSPYTHQYNVSIQKNITSRVNLDVGYLGSRSIKLLNAFTMNRALPVPGIPLTTATINQRRPNPNYSDVVEILNGGIGYLDALQAAWTIQGHGRYTIGGTYTFGKAMDDGSTYVSTAANQDLFNSRSQYQYEVFGDRKALSNFDSTHALVVYATYTLPRPARRGFTAWLTRDWQLSSTFMAKTGTPFSMNAGSDSPGFGNVDGQGSDRPNILDPSILGMTVGNPDTSAQILNASKFSFIQPGENAGNIGFNVFRRQAIVNLNSAISREWKFGKQRIQTLSFRAEAFNAANHAQFDAPQNNLAASGTFGKITNTLNSGRVFQFSARLGF